MGIYVYTMRQAKTPLVINGERVFARNYQYSYKEFYSRADDPDYKRMVSNAERFAEGAFEDYDPEDFVVVVDSDGEIHNEAPVYRNVIDPMWFDTGNFPGEYVGKVHWYRGQWAVLADRTESTTEVA
jgi:hypothetical protein